LVFFVTRPPLRKYYGIEWSIGAGDEGADLEKGSYSFNVQEDWIEGEGAVTMFSRFEKPWETAAGDGASTPVGVSPPACEVDALMDAWLRERHESVECRLYLDEAGRLLRRMLVEDGVPLRLRRRARHLLLAIRAIREAGHDRTTDED